MFFEHNIWDGHSHKFGGATAPTKGVQGLCPGKLETLCCRNGASEARPRAEGTGRKLVLYKMKARLKFGIHVIASFDAMIIQGPKIT